MRLQSCSSNPLVDAAYNAEEGDAGNHASRTAEKDAHCLHIIADNFIGGVDIKISYTVEKTGNVYDFYLRILGNINQCLTNSNQTSIFYTKIDYIFYTTFSG